MLQQLNKFILKKKNKSIKLVVIWHHVDKTIVDLTIFHIATGCHGIMSTDKEK